MEDSISDELEGRQNRMETLESVIAKLQRQNENLEEGELSKELKVKENRLKVLNGIIAKDKEMIEKLQNELTEAQQLFREGDKLITHEMSKQVQDDVRDWVQTVGWRKMEICYESRLESIALTNVMQTLLGNLALTTMKTWNSRSTISARQTSIAPMELTSRCVFLVRDSPLSPK